MTDRPAIGQHHCMPRCLHLGTSARRLVVLLAGTAGCAVMQVPPPLRELKVVEVERARGSGVVGPFTYDLARDEAPFRDQTDLHEAWDFGVSLDGHTLGSGRCRHGLEWPRQAFGDPPERRRGLRRSVECTMASLTSTAAVVLSLQDGGPGEELVGFAERGKERVHVRASHEVEGGRFLTGNRMGFRRGARGCALGGDTDGQRRAGLAPTPPAGHP